MLSRHNPWHRVSLLKVLEGCRSSICQHQFGMVKPGHGRFRSFERFRKAFPNIKFDGAGQPNDIKSCDESATLKLEDLDDVEVLQDLCCAVLKDAVHTRRKSLPSNERALYPLLLSFVDVFLRLGSRAAEIKHIPFESVGVIGSNAGNPDQASDEKADNGLQVPQQQQAQAPQEGQRQPQQQQQQQPQQAPVISTPARGDAGGISSSDTLHSLRLAYEHEHTAATSRGPIEFVYKNVTGVNIMIIDAKLCILDDNFGAHIAQACTELICLAQDNNTTDEIFGWLTDSINWVGLSFKLSEVPAKGSKTPLRDIKGIFKHTEVMAMSVKPSATFGVLYTESFPKILSEMARRLLPDCRILRDIRTQLGTYDAEMHNTAVKLLRDQFCDHRGKFGGLQEISEGSPRKRIKTSSVAGAALVPAAAAAVDQDISAEDSLVVFDKAEKDAQSLKQLQEMINMKPGQLAAMVEIAQEFSRKLDELKCAIKRDLPL